MIKNSKICIQIKDKMKEVILSQVPGCFKCSIYFDILVVDNDRKKHKVEDFVERDSSIKEDDKDARVSGSIEGLLKRAVVDEMKAIEEANGCNIKVKICMYNNDSILQDYLEFKMVQNMKKRDDKCLLKRKSYREDD